MILVLQSNPALISVSLVSAAIRDDNQSPTFSNIGILLSLTSHISLLSSLSTAALIIGLSVGFGCTALVAAAGAFYAIRNKRSTYLGI